MILIFFDILFWWTILGLVWAISYDVHTRNDIIYYKYKTSTIILGGPFWWLLFLIDYFKVHKEKFKPRTKKETRKKITSYKDFLDK